MNGRIGQVVTMVGLLTFGGGAQAASYTVGEYEVSSYFVSASASSGAACPFLAGTYLSSVYSYPGPAKAGAIARQFLNGTSGNYVLLINFPTTPAANATTWSGNVTETILPGGQPVTGTFSSKFSLVDSKSYVSTTTYVVPVTGGSCTSVVQEVGIWVAK